VGDAHGFDLDTPWKKLTKKARDILLEGSAESIYVKYKNRYGRQRAYWTTFEGILPNIERRYRETESEAAREKLEQFMREIPCRACKGQRLRPETLAVTIGDRNIADVTDLSIRDALAFTGDMGLSEREEMIAARLVKEIRARLGFLVDVGLDYLTLGRAAGTLAGGEAQRIRLATQIGSGLVGVLYILDEPSIGLHQRDNRRLLDTLIRLRDLGNTLIVVEHDEATIVEADHIVDIGPGAGEHGGEIVYSGELKGLLESDASLTGAYLSGRRTIPVPEVRRQPGERVLRLEGVREHNLQNVNVQIPLGLLVCVTGVSGSGKSTLVQDVLLRALMQKVYRSRLLPGRHKKMVGWEQIDKVIDIDQSPIGRTPRSNPATYTGVFDHVRKLYAQVPEARIRGFQPGRFSFNVRGGRCENCAGDGQIKIEMHFLPDVYVTCEVCKGRRYNRETLEVKYKGRSISDVLAMSVDEALEFFQNIPPIKRQMQTLSDVGLGYIKLGQPAPTLSGGEAQRIKLASELHKRATGNTMYVLDEPTTGLHFEDIRKLLQVLQRLVSAGNTVIVIEHNLDVVKTADWIIDLGPEGGDQGGKVVAVGTPEEGRGRPGFAHGPLPRRGLGEPSPHHRRSRARINDALTSVGSIRADVSKRPFALLAGLAMLAAACASNPTATSVDFGSGVRFVPVVADSLDNVGLGSAVALTADGLPYVTYFGFPAVVKEGEIPIPRPIGSPFLPGVLLSSVDANGVWTHGAIEQAKPKAGLPSGITVPFGPVTTENLQLTADDSNGTAVALGSDGTVHAAWTMRDGVYYGTTKADGTSTVEQVFKYGSAVSLAGPISAPGIALDSGGNPWVAFSVLGSGGLEVHAATLTGSKWTDQVVATRDPAADAPEPGPTGIAVLRGNPVVVFGDGAKDAVEMASLQGSKWIVSDVETKRAGDWDSRSGPPGTRGTRPTTRDTEP
jgi:energy-coupling factor transporter ATP-binding protein EcfA2